MGYMQVYRVGGTRSESALKKISLLLTGEGIDCDELADNRPQMGCVLIDFSSGEELVKKTLQSVPQLPQIVVTSTQTLGSKQLAIADEFVSPDLPSHEIIRRVQCMDNLATRIQEEVPKPTHTRILIDGETEGDEATLKKLAGILKSAEINWEQLKEDNDKDGSGIIYTHYRRENYARMLQADFPGYAHIQMTLTAEQRNQALTVGDISYTPDVGKEEIITRHIRLLHMLDRLRNPENFKHDPLEHRNMTVFFIGDRNEGNDLRNSLTEGIDVTSSYSLGGAIAESKKHDAVIIHLGGNDEAKERLAFLQMLLKDQSAPPKALYFTGKPSERLQEYCQKNGVVVIEKQNPNVRERLLKMRL
jgi:hypothetical protein